MKKKKLNANLQSLPESLGNTLQGRKINIFGMVFNSGKGVSLYIF